ncbi:hypothetical protein D3C72_1590350 [compost metagenome]
MLDAQCEQQSLQRRITAGIDRSDQVVSPLGGDLLRVPFEGCRLRQCQRAPPRIVAIELQHRVEHRAAAFGRQVQFQAGRERRRVFSIQHQLQVQQLVTAEAVQIGHAPDDAGVHQGFDVLVAKAVDIHRPS